MSRDLQLEIGCEKEFYGQWKEGQASWEHWRDVSRPCREEICMARAQLELEPASTVKDNQKGFLRYVNGKRQTRNNIVPLLNEHGHLISSLLSLPWNSTPKMDLGAPAALA